MVIYAAMNMNVCVAGCLMKPPAPLRHLPKTRSSKNFEHLSNSTGSSSNSFDPSSNSSNRLSNTSKHLSRTSQPLSTTTDPLSNAPQHLSDKSELSLNITPPGLSKKSSTWSKISRLFSKDPNSLSHHKDQVSDNRCTCDGLIDYIGVSVLTHYPILFIYFFAMTLHEFVSGGWVVFLVPYSVSLGFNLKASSFLTTVGGVGALIGRLVVGPFVDGGLISGRMMFCILATSGALVMFIYPFTSMYWGLSVVSFLTGFFLASTTPIFVVMMRDILHEGANGFAAAVGWHYRARGFGTLFGGPITGEFQSSGFFYYTVRKRNWQSLTDSQHSATVM